jgi:hypothetical protein
MRKSVASKTNSEANRDIRPRLNPRLVVGLLAARNIYTDRRDSGVWIPARGLECGIYYERELRAGEKRRKESKFEIGFQARKYIYGSSRQWSLDTCSRSRMWDILRAVDMRLRILVY